MLHTKAVEPATLELLRNICTEEKLEKFALIGGTNLALRLGHRKSIDLDFFSKDKFNETALDKFIKDKYQEVKTTHLDKQTRQYQVNGIKVEFIRFNYPLLDKIELVEGVRMYSLKDTVAGKLNAITQRGSKKDFYDVYELLKTNSLDEMIGYYKEKFNQDNPVPLIKSLNYYEDAERMGEEVNSLNKTSWKDVKQGIDNRLNEYLKSQDLFNKRGRGMGM